MLIVYTLAGTQSHKIVFAARVYNRCLVARRACTHILQVWRVLALDRREKKQNSCQEMSKMVLRVCDMTLSKTFNDANLTIKFNTRRPTELVEILLCFFTFLREQRVNELVRI